MWPWIAQLGKGRAGWYAPGWLETMLDRRAARTVRPEFLNPTVGQVHDDWGPALLRVAASEPPRLLLFEGVRKPNAGSERAFPSAC